MSEAVAVSVPDEDSFTLYDARGLCVGRACMSAGRALIGDRFWRADEACRMEFDTAAGMCRCSECGRYSIQAVYGMQRGEFNYCPNCGRRVVEE